MDHCICKYVGCLVFCWNINVTFVSDIHLSDCDNTGYKNDFDGELTYSVPENYTLTGLYSEHNNHHE